MNSVSTLKHFLSHVRSGHLVRTLAGKSRSNMANATVDTIADVEIDGSGDFKYILVNIKDKQGNEKVIVRGTARCFYHADILDEFTDKKLLLKKNVDCPGGGRITHSPEAKSIKVYGESVGFGRADHKLAAEILKKFYPDYKINVSNE